MDDFIVAKKELDGLVVKTAKSCLWMQNSLTSEMLDLKKGRWTVDIITACSIYT